MPGRNASYARRAGKTPDSLLATPLGESWLFLRGQKPRKVHKFDLECHERYVEPGAGVERQDDYRLSA